MARRIHIIVAEPSVIIRRGLVSVLSKLPMLNIDVAEISDISNIVADLNRYSPDILIVDPSNLGVFSLQQIKNDILTKSFKVVALQSVMISSATLNHYDAVISIYDGLNAIKEKLVSLVNTEDTAIVKQELTAREREIVVCIVKGMTNKQIADSLSLSAHTIMAHRRNITNKLQIHSSSGLTIYAIVNKFVDINDIKDTIFSED